MSSSAIIILQIYYQWLDVNLNADTSSLKWMLTVYSYVTCIFLFHEGFQLHREKWLNLHILQQLGISSFAGYNCQIKHLQSSFLQHDNHDELCGMLNSYWYYKRLLCFVKTTNIISDSFTEVKSIRRCIYSEKVHQILKTC